MKKIITNLIPQNTALLNAKNIAVFDQSGKVVASLPLGHLSAKSSGQKQYSFGALADVHLPYSSVEASGDFQKALAYYNNVADVDFICISGDMSDTGTEAEWTDYKNHVDTYSPNTTVHLATGNHDATTALTYEYPRAYTGNPLYYSFIQGNDVFIMFGMTHWGSTPFSKESLQWLYETLEVCRNKRCFVFQHMMRLDGCGNAHGLYGWDGLSNTSGQVFLSLMEHYKNCIWFHGHSHTPFKLQRVQPTPIANYDRLFGCHSVHIPSLATPRYGESNNLTDAEGYVVDVYKNGIHLKGIDFIESEFVPIASYWIDTTPIDIKQFSYEDPTGTIKVAKITLPLNSELYMNQRYSYSGNGLVTDTNTPSMFTAIIPVEPSTNYVIKIQNSNIPINTASGSVIYGLDSSKMPVQYINNGNIPNMSSGITYSEDKKSADIDFTTSPDVCYVALSLKAADTGTIKEVDLRNYIIILENTDKGSLPEGTEIVMDAQFSESGGGLVYNSSYQTFFVPVSPLTSYEFTVSGLINENLSKDQCTLYELKPDKTFNCRINGSKYIHSMIDTTISDNNTSATVKFTTTASAGYISLTPVMPSSHIGSVRITLRKIGSSELSLRQEEVTSQITWQLDTRLSGADGSYKTQENSVASSDIFVQPNDTIRIYGFTTKSNFLYVSSFADGTFVDLVSLELYDSSSNNSMQVNYDTENNVLTIIMNSSSIANSIRIANECSNIFVLRVLKNIELTIGEITDEVTWQFGKRLSSETGDYKDADTSIASSDIPVSIGDIITVHGVSSLVSAPCYVNGYKDGSFVINSPLSNSGMNPHDTNYTTSSYDTEKNIITVAVKNNNIDAIRICTYASSASAINLIKVFKNDMGSKNPIVIPEGSELYMNQRYSQSGGGMTNSTGSMAVIMPINDSNATYTFSVSNMPNTFLKGDSATFYQLDENRQNARNVNGSNYVHSMTTGMVMADDYRSATITFTPSSSMVVKYVVFNIPIISDVAITREDLNGIVITLNKN